MYRRPAMIATLLLITLLITACDRSDSLTLYSGRGESMVKPIVERFEQATGIRVEVRYGGTSQLAVLLQEEGQRTPADLFWGQDAGAMGALGKAGLLAPLPSDIYQDLPPIYSSETGRWVAASGRARVFVYSPERTRSNALPQSIFDLTDPHYKGRVGWAPTNGSFQSFVTAMRVKHGDEVTLKWLQDMKANNAQVYRNNSTQVQAVADGQIDFGIVNNYYLPRSIENDSDFPASQAFFQAGDIGNMVNVAGIGIIAGTDMQPEAEAFIRFLLSAEAQQYFTSTVYEYPVIGNVEQNPRLESFEHLLDVAPSINLDDLEDLEGTLGLLRQADLI
ncbi:MAG: iron ABC transporter substrate-binding protein [Halomonadaceae bacterium]|nr:MAG: iron ABC transporter substrate-binding protein [Halomonadaceae bacterium]